MILDFGLWILEGEIILDYGFWIMNEEAKMKFMEDGNNYGLGFVDFGLGKHSTSKIQNS